MKHLLPNAVIVFLLFFSSVLVSNAQLRFPMGTVMNLNTHVNFLYFETEILFYTGEFPVDYYNWEKISDSINTSWLISSCFNGECLNGLPQNGAFVKSYGINDTTGYIRFHVVTCDTNGKSVIKYRVVNKNDPADQAELTFNITFEKELGIMPDRSHSQNITVLQNTQNNSIRIQLNNAGRFLCGRIVDVHGKTVQVIADINKDVVLNDDAKGINIIEIRTSDNIYFKKIIR